MFICRTAWTLILGVVASWHIHLIQMFVGVCPLMSTLSTSLTPVTTTFTLCHIRPLLGLDTAKAMAVSILLAVDSAVVPSVL